MKLFDEISNPLYLQYHYFLNNKKENTMGFMSGIFKAFGNETKALMTSANDKYKKQDYKGAIEDYNKAIETGPKDPADIVAAYLYRGYAKAETKDHSSAINDFEQVIEMIPHFSEAYLCKSRSKFELGDLEGALKDVNKAIDLNPTDRHALLFRTKINEKMSSGEQ
jgi:tetratricopeptide (TPR) repeat protein